MPLSKGLVAFMYERFTVVRECSFDKKGRGSENQGDAQLTAD